MNKPLYVSSYGFTAFVNGRPILFVNKTEYEAYINED